MISSPAVAESSPSSRLASDKSIVRIIVLLCFFILCSCFTSSAVDLAMKKPLLLPLNGHHVELATLVSTNSPLTSVSKNIDGTETSLVVTTEVKDVSVDSIIEQYQHATSNSKSRSVCRWWWSWIQRLILMCFCLMVGEGSSGTPPEDDKPRAVAEMEESPRVASKKWSRYSTKTMVIVLLCIFTLCLCLIISSHTTVGSFMEDWNAVRPLAEPIGMQLNKNPIFLHIGVILTLSLLVMLAGSFKKWCFRNRIDDVTRKTIEEQVEVEMHERLERLAGPKPNVTTLFVEEFVKARPTATTKEALDAFGSLSKEEMDKWKSYCSAVVEEWSDKKENMEVKAYDKMEAEVDKKIEKYLDEEYRKNFVISLHGESK